MKKKILIIIVIVLGLILLNQEPKKMGTTSISGFAQAFTEGGTFQQLKEDGNAWVSEGDYNAYFVQNPDVKIAAFDNLENQEYFWDYIDELESTGEVTVDYPIDMEDDKYAHLTQDEWEHVQAAKYAHSIWLDKNNLVPWSLSDYSMEELNTLYAQEHLCSNTPCLMYSVVDYHPTEAYDYASQFLAADPTQTVYNIIDDLRSDFRHSNPNIHDIDVSLTLKETLETYDEGGKRVSLIGCHSMCRISVFLLRSINIPSYHEHGWFGGTGHCSSFIFDSGILNHADNIYDSTLTDTPTDQLLMPWSYFEGNVEPCGRNTNCSNYWTRRYQSLQTIQYTPQSVIDKMCDPTRYNYDDLEHYLTLAIKVIPYVSDEELQSFIDDILSRC